MSRFQNSPMFQRVLEFKKGNIAPVVKADTGARALRTNVGPRKRYWPVEKREDVVLCN